MATWKKVIVSGSNISQLSNDSGYLTAGTLTQANGFATASFAGTSLVADNVTGSLNFASSSGQGLTISATAGTDTLTWGLSAVPNSSLANSAITIAGTSTSLGGSITQTQILASSGVWSGSAQLPTGVVSGSSQVVALLPAGTVSGSSQVSFSGLSGVPSGLVSGSSQILASLSGSTIHSGSYFAGITVVSGSSQITFSGISGVPTGLVSGSSQITYSGITGIPSGIVSASVLSSPGQGQALLTTNGVAGSTIDLGLETGDSPSFAGVTAGNVTVGVTTDNTINTSTGNLTINSAGGTTTLDDNVVITGNLSVDGTTTYVNTVDLLVEDPFILLASGSAGDTDGGIIIDRGTYVAGNIAFGYDAGTDRWGYQSGLVDTTNAIDTTSSSGVSGSFAGIVFTQAAHGATKPITGEFAKEGAIYTATNEDIWIYS